MNYKAEYHSVLCSETQLDFVLNYVYIVAFSASKSFDSTPSILSYRVKQTPTSYPQEADTICHPILSLERPEDSESVFCQYILYNATAYRIIVRFH